jgi:hypothetical protein
VDEAFRRDFRNMGLQRGEWEDKVPKGRPPLVPRIEELESKVRTLEERMVKLESVLTAIPTLQPVDYAPQFARWTINGK